MTLYDDGLTSMPAKVGRSWSKKGSNVEPCVAKRECITSATLRRYCSSVSSFEKGGREREREKERERESHQSQR